MIDYYSQLCETAEIKKSKVENHIKTIHNINLDDSPGRGSSTQEHAESASSNDSFHTVDEEPPKTEHESDKFERITEEEKVESSSMPIHSSNSMDILNANSVEAIADKNANVKDEIPKTVQQAIENFRMAKKIKEKVMQQELGLDFSVPLAVNLPQVSNTTSLTQAQKNKLKVLSSEFGISLKIEEIPVIKYQSALSENRKRVLGVSDCFIYDKPLDNEVFLNRNIKNLENDHSTCLKQSKSLTLDFEKISQNSFKLDSENPLPMSVDSTPLSDLPHSIVTTPSTMFMSVDSGPFGGTPSTAETQQSEEEFNFTLKPKSSQATSIVPLYINRRHTSSRKTFSKRVTKEEASVISSNCLKMFLHESVEIPLAAQSRLINDGLLSYFINDLKYLEHLKNIRDFFFFQDGEFGRIITDNLFSKLYEANNPRDLINIRTFRNLDELLSKNQDGSNNLSFEIIDPERFNLGSPDVLNCVFLSYKVQWPLNILLPKNTIGKYDEIFKFLWKLNRMVWVLKSIFMVS